MALEKGDLYRLPWSMNDNPIAWLEITDICNIYCEGCYRQRITGHKPVEEVKEEVIRKVAGKKAEEKARQTAEEILNQMKTGKGFSEAIEGKSYSVEETGLFARTGGVIPKIGPAGEWMASLASLTEAKPLPKEPFRTKEGYFVVRHF